MIKPFLAQGCGAARLRKGKRGGGKKGRGKNGKKDKETASSNKKVDCAYAAN